MKWNSFKHFVIPYKKEVKGKHRLKQTDKQTKTWEIILKNALQWEHAPIQNQRAAQAG